MRRIAVAGHVCVDIRPQLSTNAQIDPGRLIEVGPASISLGGSVGNTGLNLVALGAEITVFTSIGDDDLGKLVHVDLASTPLVHGHAHVVDGASTSYSLIFESPGIDRTIWHNVGANATFDGGDVELDGIDLLHLGYPPLLPALLVDGGEPLRALLANARENGVTTSVDLAVVDPASAVGALDWGVILMSMAGETDVISPSLDDLTSALRIDEPYSPSLVARLADQLIEWGVAVVAISAGEHGIYLKTGSEARLARAGRALAALASEWSDQALYAPPVWIEAAATTNGAGDASSAGLLFGIAIGTSAKEAVDIASACSAALVSGDRTTPQSVAKLRPDLSHLFHRSPTDTHTEEVSPVKITMKPIVLPSNQPADRFYLGGAQIASLRGEIDSGPRTPEDWVASTTTVRGHSVLGRTLLPSGQFLDEAIESDPVAWLGEEHTAVFGSDTKLLVKLLDAGQRLPVHAHPGGNFAEQHLGARHGKAEAWYFLTPGVVYLGLRENILMDELAKLVSSQSVERMLELMHEVHVQPHDTVYVPAGVLHAIGNGVLLVEVQEPEDLSILLEWRDFEIDGTVDGHLGLGFDTALTAVEISGRTADEIEQLIVRTTSRGSSLAASSAEYFQLERVPLTALHVCEPGFAVLIVIDGEAHLVPESGETLILRHGSTAVIPHSAGPFTLRGSGTVLVARPPKPR